MAARGAGGARVQAGEEGLGRVEGETAGWGLECERARWEDKGCGAFRIACLFVTACFRKRPPLLRKKKSYCTLAVTGFLIEMFSAFSLARLHSTYSSDIADKENVTARDSKVPNDCIISTRRFFFLVLLDWMDRNNNAKQNPPCWKGAKSYVRIFIILRDG
jgi:hypothetical protein